MTILSNLKFKFNLDKKSIEFFNKLIYFYHISDMIPVALPQHRAGAGLTRSLFPVPRTQIVQ